MFVDVFFFQRSATRSVHESKKELQRNPELRGAENLYERKPTPRNPGVGKTVARERYTLNRLLRKATRKKAAGRQCTTAKYACSTKELRRGALEYNATATPRLPREQNVTTTPR